MDEQIEVMSYKYAMALINDWNRYQYNGRIKTNLVKRAEAFMKSNYQNNTHYAQHRERILLDIRVKKLKIQHQRVFFPMVLM
jgi:hypothetical protein